MRFTLRDRQRWTVGQRETVGMSGAVNRLKVSLADENHRDKHMQIYDVKEKTVQKSSDNVERSDK